MKITVTSNKHKKNKLSFDYFILFFLYIVNFLY